MPALSAWLHCWQHRQACSSGRLGAPKPELRRQGLLPCPSTRGRSLSPDRAKMGCTLHGRARLSLCFDGIYCMSSWEQSCREGELGWKKGAGRGAFLGKFKIYEVVYANCLQHGKLEVKVVSECHRSGSACKCSKALYSLPLCSSPNLCSSSVPQKDLVKRFVQVTTRLAMEKVEQICRVMKPCSSLLKYVIQPA